MWERLQAAVWQEFTVFLLFSYTFFFFVGNLL